MGVGGLVPLNVYCGYHKCVIYPISPLRGEQRKRTDPLRKALFHDMITSKHGFRQQQQVWHRQAKE